VYNNPLPTVKRQIHQAEHPTPAVVISMEPAHVDNAIILDYLTSEVAIEAPGFGITDPNIPMDNDCTDGEVHFGTPGGCGDFDDQGDESDAIPVEVVILEKLDCI
jgi:hypothetical protein